MCNMIIMVYQTEKEKDMVQANWCAHDVCVKSISYVLCGYESSQVATCLTADAPLLCYINLSITRANKKQNLGRVVTK